MSKYFNPAKNTRAQLRRMVTGGAPTSSHNAFLDTNVFGKLMRANFDPVAYIETSLRDSGEKNVTSVNIITSPFALFEYLGLSITKPPDLKISREKFTKCPPPLIVKEAMEYAMKFYSDVKNLNLESLRIRTEEMKKYVTPEARFLFDGLIIPFTTPDRIDIIRQNLAWDFVMNLQVPASVHEYYYKGVMTGLVYYHSEATNFPFSKPAAECMKFVIKEFLKENRNHVGAEAARSSLSFKTKGDHIDRELLHFALVGWHYNTKLPLLTHCFTADPVPDVESRLQNLGAVYSQYYDASTIDVWKSQIDKVAEALPGFVHCIDHLNLSVQKSLSCSRYFTPGI